MFVVALNTTKTNFLILKIEVLDLSLLNMTNKKFSQNFIYFMFYSFTLYFPLKTRGKKKTKKNI